MVDDSLTTELERLKAENDSRLDSRRLRALVGHAGHGRGAAVSAWGGKMTRSRIHERCPAEHASGWSCVPRPPRPPE